MLAGRVGCSEGATDPEDGWCCPSIVGADLVPSLRADIAALDRFLAGRCRLQDAEMMLTQLAALTQSGGDLSETEARLRVCAMAAMLTEYPHAIVAQACRQYALEKIFFPALAELIARITPSLAHYRRQGERMRALLRRAEEDSSSRVETEQEQQAQQERKDRGCALLAAMRRKLAGQATPDDLALLEDLRKQKETL